MYTYTPMHTSVYLKAFVYIYTLWMLRRWFAIEASGPIFIKCLLYRLLYINSEKYYV